MLSSLSFAAGTEYEMCTEIEMKPKKKNCTFAANAICFILYK